MARRSKEPPTPEDFAAYIEAGKAAIAEACVVAEEPAPQKPAALDDPNLLPNFKKQLEKAYKQDTREHNQAARKVAHSSQTAFLAALQVPEYNYAPSSLPEGTLTGTLNPKGMLAVLDTGLVPTGILPPDPATGKAVTQEEARAILKTGGEQAQAFATMFSARMKGDLLDRAIENPAILKDVIGTACDAATATPPPPPTPPKQEREQEKWNIPSSR